MRHAMKRYLCAVIRVDSSHVTPSMPTTAEEAGASASGRWRAPMGHKETGMTSVPGQ